MEVNEKDIFLIEEYLEGNLSDEAKSAFDKRIQTDEDFARAFELRKTMPGLLQHASEYKNVREEVRRELNHSRPKIVRLNRVMVYSVAASVVLLAAIFVVLQYTVFNRDDSSSMMAESSDSTEQILKVDNPVEYGNIAVKNNGVLLLSPVNDTVLRKGSEIILQWETKLTDSAKLVLIEKSGHSVVLEKMILLSAGACDIRNMNLESGAYSWHIGDKAISESFSVE